MPIVLCNCTKYLFLLKNFHIFYIVPCLPTMYFLFNDIKGLDHKNRVPCYIVVEKDKITKKKDK